MLNRLFIIAAALFSSLSVIAQDVQFTQFYANPLYLNPAMTGAKRCPKVHLNYRNQWPGLGNLFVTYSASYDQHFEDLKGGLGILVMKDDQAGTISSTDFSGLYAFSFKVNSKLTMRMGIQASYIQRKLNWDNLVYPYDLQLTKETSNWEVPLNLSKPYPDFSTGIVGYSKNLYFGLAIHHLAQPETESKIRDKNFIPRKYTLHLGKTIQLRGGSHAKDRNSISPNIIIMHQRDFQQIHYGFYVNKNSLVYGLWFRQHLSVLMNSVNLLVGVNFNKFNFAYSFDLPVNRLALSSYGTHEVSLGLNFACRYKIKKYDAIMCPEF